jgi:hypothetical protein
MKTVRSWVLAAAALVAPIGLSGCYSLATGAATPIPVPPWVTERIADRYANQNDFRTPVMPPIREGFPPPLCEDPPDEARINRTMPTILRGVPYVAEQFRDDLQFVSERMVDKIDPPRFFPLIGPAQLHHCHWKCTVYYNETIESGYPFPFQVKKPRVQVLYIDLDHLHLYPCATPETQMSVTRDIIGS